MTLESKLIKIIKEDKPRYITIEKQRYYISRAKLDEFKKIISTEKEGGFLPLILAALGALGALAGGGAAVAGTVLSNKNEREKNEEQNRHNLEMEKTLQSGSGLDNFNMPVMHRKLLKKTLKHVNPYITITKTNDGNGLILYPQYQTQSQTQYRGNGNILYPSDIN